MSALLTPGPWRWEINRKHKSLQLVGGVPRFDLTVLDFERWGMSGAVARFRTGAAGFNIMKHAREFAAPFVGREHHADWCAAVVHPDANVIAAAPDLLAALKLAHAEHGKSVLFGTQALRAMEAAIAKAEGRS